MPRALRIEFENAHYHVMNRAFAGRDIFASPECYQSFLDILGEACSRYGLVVLAYCLLHNQYHLLIKTPRGNLSRVMHHINGVYTQYHNRVKVNQGPLFKGRFKAVLVEHSDALLKLSHYIHQRPTKVKKQKVKNLADYSWSSYQAYVGITQPLYWLEQATLLNLLEHEDESTSYAELMASEVTEEVLQWYGRSHLPSVIGSKKFKASLTDLSTASKQTTTQEAFTITQIINGVAHFYNVTEDDITQVIRGPQQTNHKRKIAMYLCQELTGSKLHQIANTFNLNNLGSASHATHQVRQWVKTNSKLKEQVEEIIKHIQQLNT